MKRLISRWKSIPKRLGYRGGGGRGGVEMVMGMEMKMEMGKDDGNGILKGEWDEHILRVGWIDRWIDAFNKWLLMDDMYGPARRPDCKYDRNDQAPNHLPVMDETPRCVLPRTAFQSLRTVYPRTQVLTLPTRQTTSMNRISGMAHTTAFQPRSSNPSTRINESWLIQSHSHPRMNNLCSPTRKPP